MAKAYVEMGETDLTLEEYEDFLRGSGAFTDASVVENVATFHPLGFPIPESVLYPDENGAVV